MAFFPVVNAFALNKKVSVYRTKKWEITLIAKNTTKKPSPGDPDKSSDPKDKASLPSSHQEEPALTPASNTSKENQSLPVQQPLLPEVRPQPPQTSVSSVAALLNLSKNTYTSKKHRIFHWLAFLGIVSNVE
uniref:Uncharacterized protein n=1 Tax=Panagrolaimus davidi TaxID=227884 RepID=A0A914PLH7_9BILA